MLCSGFGLGAAAGIFLVGLLDRSAAAELGRSVIEGFSSGGVSPWVAVLGCLGPALGAVAAGLTVYCRAVHPLIFFGRGLGTAYAVSAVYCASPDLEGIVAVLGIFGPRTVLMMAGLTVLCMDSYAKTLGGHRMPEGEQCYAPDKAFVVRSAVCVAFAAAAALCVIYLSPRAVLLIGG